MGSTKKSILRVVIDTNVLVSALLFKGLPSHLVELWQKNKFTLLLSREIIYEYIRTLSYPKFKLSPGIVKRILEEEVLPFAETVQIITSIHRVSEDPDDDKILECALDGQAGYVISGDTHLLKVAHYRGIAIVTPRAFLEKEKA